MQISLNIIDILCLHIFFWIRSNSCITFIVFLPNTIKVIREFERIQKKICRHKMSIRWTRHAGHCWRSRDELIRDVLSWTPTHGRAKAGRLARTYIQQLCEDTGCCPEDLPRAMNDREEWRERVRDIRSTSAICCWWWWWYLIKFAYIYIYIYIYILHLYVYIIILGPTRICITAPNFVPPRAEEFIQSQITKNNLSHLIFFLFFFFFFLLGWNRIEISKKNLFVTSWIYL